MELQLSISPSNDYSGLISFRIDWFDLLAVQGTLKSLLQHHNSKAYQAKIEQIYLLAQLKKIRQMIETIVFKTLGTRQCGRVIHENREINEVNLMF